MINAILSRDQWEYIGSLKSALLDHHRVTLRPFDQTYQRVVATFERRTHDKRTS